MLKINKVYGVNRLQMSKKYFIKNLTNKNPTKDITEDDIKFKIPKITSKKKKMLK